MGKHEVGTPKYIANKIKAKGLQKLRWYCQMCQKQCRDENGFKCHTMSASHQRQLLMFADNQSKYMDEFSQNFADGYLSLLKRQFGTKRVPANRVYQEYIADRNHIHMNATNWLSLTAFVKWLGRAGHCVVDETEKGWFVTYIDRDPETLALMEKQEKKQKLDKGDKERMMEFIEKQVEQGKKESSHCQNTEATPLCRPEDDTPLVLDMKIKPKPKALPILSTTLTKPIKSEDKSIETGSHIEDSKHKRKQEDSDSERKKIKIESDSDKVTEQGWLRNKIVVKIITKSMGEKYYKAKGTIVEIVDKKCYVGKIKLNSPEKVKGHIIKIDQEYLETVIPGVGKEVLVLNGPHREKVGIIDKVRIDDYCVDIKVSGDVIKRLPYEDVCKFEI